MRAPEPFPWFQEEKSGRNLLVDLLRNPKFDDSTCVAVLGALISVFLMQVEAFLWNRGIFRAFEEYEVGVPPDLVPFRGVWIYPFDRLSAAQMDGLWLHVVIVYLVNAILVDRFVARHSGWDVSFRPWVLQLRRLFAGLPLLGFCVFPGWRLLRSLSSKWLLQQRAPRLTLEDLKERPDQALKIVPVGASGLGIFTFVWWLLASNVYGVRAGLAWLNVPERSTQTTLLTLQVICAALRVCGLVCTLAYTRWRTAEGTLWGRSRSGLLASSVAWLLPGSLFVLAPMALYWFGGRASLVSHAVDVKPSGRGEPHGRPVSSALLRWFLREPSTLDDATRKLRRLYREKSFLLMMEMASALMVIVPLRERFPLIVLPGGFLALLCLIALPLLPVAAFLQIRVMIRWLSWSTDWKRQQLQSPFSCYLLLTSLAIVTGFIVGGLAGKGDHVTLGRFLLVGGGIGAMISPAVVVCLPTDRGAFIWPFVFLTLGGMGARMGEGGEVARLQILKLYLAIPLVLFLSIILGACRCRWLVRPFRLRDVFNPSLSRALRLKLAFLGLTPCMPMSGLLIPVWIRIRTSLGTPIAVAAPDRSASPCRDSSCRGRSFPSP